MRVTVSNKKCKVKPTDKQVGLYFGTKGKNPFKWCEIECNVSQFKTLVENGYTLTYLLTDITSSKRKNNYKGTQFICVDVDATDLTAQEVIDKMVYKPTIWHTTFSHKTERKEYKNCYHFYFMLKEVVNGEDNFNKLFTLFTKGIEDIYDKCAKDCNRCTFTSNKNNEGFEIGELDNIYDGYKLLEEDNNTNSLSFDDFINGNVSWEKMKSIDISMANYNISRESKISQNTEEQIKLPSNEFNLDSEFFKDLNTLQRSEFLAKYAYKYPYADHTIIEDAEFINGYVDLRDRNYYEVPTAQYSWNSETGKAEVKKIHNGHRTTMLWLDAIAFCKIFPNITKEHLVYLLVSEVYQHFMNGDGQLNNYFIIQKAKDVYNNINNLSIEPVKKAFKLDTSYWHNLNISPLEATRIVRSRIKSNDIGSLYDCSLTIEANVKMFKEYGVNTTKSYLIKWCSKNGIDFVTDKDYRNDMIIYYYNEDDTRSSRDIEKLCKDNGIDVSYKTIQTILSNYKKLGNFEIS